MYSVQLQTIQPYSILHSVSSVHLTVHVQTNSGRLATQPAIFSGDYGSDQREQWKSLDHWNKLPSGKRSHSYGKSPFSMGKSTISMAIFNSYVKLPEGTWGNKSSWPNPNLAPNRLTHHFRPSQHPEAPVLVVVIRVSSQIPFFTPSVSPQRNSFCHSIAASNTFWSFGKYIVLYTHIMSYNVI